MSRMSVYTCDGPACLETLDEAEDDDDLASAGWFLISFQVEDEEDESTAHLCSYACVAAWAAEVANG